MKSYITIFFSFLVTLSFAQYDWFDIPFRVNHSEAVFEGTITSRESFIDERSDKIYTRNTVRIHKVFKGGLDAEYVEVIERGGQVGDRFTVLSHGSNLFVGKHSLFFVKPCGLEMPDMPQALRICEGDLQLDFNRDVAWDEYRAYHGIEAKVFREIERTTGTRRQLRELTPYEREKGYVIKDNTLINESVEDLCEENAPSITSERLNLKFDNVYVEDGDGYYLHFDIKVATNVVGALFYDAEITLDYDDGLFGENISANENVEVTRREVVESLDYDISHEDAGANRLKVNVNASASSDLYDLTASGVPYLELCHVRVRIQDFVPDFSPDVEFVEELMSASYWDDALGDSKVFTKICVSEPINVSAAETLVPNQLNYGLGLSSYYEENGEYYYDVHILASTEVATKIHTLAFTLDYNPATFGSDAASSNTVEVSDFLNSNYAVSVSDDAPNRVKVVISNSTPVDLIGENDLENVDGVPLIVATVTFKVLDCANPANVSLPNLNPATQAQLLLENLHWVGAPDYTSAYTAITYGLFDYLEICPPASFSLSEYAFPAGTKEILTLVGEDFGETPGRVFFRSAGTTFTETYTYGQNTTNSDPTENGIQSWSDTQIELWVPSNGGDPTALDSPPFPLYPKTAATGKVTVQKADNTLLESAWNLYVPYSITHSAYGIGVNAPINFTRRINLVDANGSGGYTIHLSQDLENTIPNAKLCTELAMLDWKCNTHVNWEMASTFATSNAQNPSDNVCLLYIGGSGMEFPSTATTAVTVLKNRAETCFADGGERTYYLREFDMGFRDPATVTDLNYFSDPTSINVPDGQVDFYSLVLHELGHAHLLQHTLNNHQVMFTVLNSGEVKRNLSEGDLDGGVYNVNQSVNYDFGVSSGCTSDNVSNMIKADCTTGVMDSRKSPIVFELYPNSNNGDFTILFNEGNPAHVLLELVDLRGRIIYQEVLHVHSGKQQIQLSQRGISSGTYIVRLIHGGGQDSRKIVITDDE